MSGEKTNNKWKKKHVSELRVSKLKTIENQINDENQHRNMTN